MCCSLPNQVLSATCNRSTVSLGMIGTCNFQALLNIRAGSLPGKGFRKLTGQGTGSYEALAMRTFAGLLGHDWPRLPSQVARQHPGQSDCSTCLSAIVANLAVASWMHSGKACLAWFAPEVQWDTDEVPSTACLDRRRELSRC